MAFDLGSDRRGDPVGEVKDGGRLHVLFLALNSFGCKPTEWCSSNREAFAPGSIWRSRRWHGWSCATGRRCTAFITSSTIAESWSGSAPSESSSSMARTRCRVGAPVLLSAHGSSPATVAAVEARACVLVLTRCAPAGGQGPPRRSGAAWAAAGHDVLYVGHHGHDEAIGALGVAPERTTLVSSAADLEGLRPSGRPVALLAQTTLAVSEWAAVLAGSRQRFGEVWTPKRDDICYATTNRQEALRAAASEADAVVVVGSASSANTAALVDLARAQGVATVLRVDGADDLPRDVHVGTLVLTAGAVRTRRRGNRGGGSPSAIVGGAGRHRH